MDPVPMVGVLADHLFHHARGALGGFQDRVVTVSFAHDIERRKHQDAMVQAGAFADNESRNRGDVGSDRQPRQTWSGASLARKEVHKDSAAHVEVDWNSDDAVAAQYCEHLKGGALARNHLISGASPLLISRRVD